MEKTGLFDYLNKLGEDKQSLMDKYPALSGNKPASPAGSVNPATSAAPVSSAATSSDSQISDDHANQLFTPVKIIPVTNLPKIQPTNTAPSPQTAPTPVAPPVQIGQTGISPDVLQARNTSQDQLATQMAAPPPPQMNLPKYGGSSGDGTATTLTALSLLAKFLI
jgi:hypothetical protein